MASTKRSYATLRGALLATSLFGGMAVADQAFAQDDAVVEEIIITGTRIRSANVESVSPIVQIGGEEFAARGATRTEDLVNALIAALALYGITTLGWVWILRHAPLHMAYPFMGLAFLIVPTLAWTFLGEPLHWRTLAGGALIMAGVALASTS